MVRAVQKIDSENLKNQPKKGFEKVMKNHRKFIKKVIKNRAKIHQTIDAEKHVKIAIRSFDSRGFLSPGKHIQVNKTHTDILQKAS